MSTARPCWVVVPQARTSRLMTTLPPDERRAELLSEPGAERHHALRPPYLCPVLAVNVAQQLARPDQGARPMEFILPDRLFGS